MSSPPLSSLNSKRSVRKINFYLNVQKKQYESLKIVKNYTNALLGVEYPIGINKVPLQFLLHLAIKALLFLTDSA